VKTGKNPTSQFLRDFCEIPTTSRIPPAESPNGPPANHVELCSLLDHLRPLTAALLVRGPHLYPVTYLPEQAPGEHTAVIRIKSLPEGAYYYARQLFVVGEIMP
jgi:hypothetical protein